MCITLADKYYVKAFDEYPYDLESSIDNLNYALSYDADHAGAICLMGRIQFEQLRNYKSAEEHFIEALACDPFHLDTCMYYSSLLIQIGDFSKAHKLIRHSFTIKGVDVAMMKALEGLVFEYQKNYSEAISAYESAMSETYNKDYMESLLEDIKRVKSKIKALNKDHYQYYLQSN